MYPTPRLAELVDIAPEFWKVENQLYLTRNATSFDAERAAGLLQWQRNVRSLHVHFNYTEFRPNPAPEGEFPPNVYVQDPALPFSFEFVTPRTLRLRMKVGVEPRKPLEELMLAGPVPTDSGWRREPRQGGATYTSEAGVSLSISLEPFHFEIRDAGGRLVTQAVTDHQRRAMPFAFVRRAGDLRRHLAATFTLKPDEKIVGCGESFTRLDKRGQKVFLWTFDAWECQGAEMYKPVPFFMSSEGYGMFVHTSAPVTLDVGQTHDHFQTIYSGDDELDLFIFVGTPQEILAEYTALTGRSPVPPLWTFGLWMSRITYDRETQVREVAARLRSERIPCDVIHLDTGWFEEDWC
ncbi:MAG TPA: TIM-barrel domain-containing protein, partial [Polyangiaceae bacterium]